MTATQPLSVAAPGPDTCAPPWVEDLSQLARLRHVMYWRDAEPRALLRRESELRAVELDFVESHRATLRARVAQVPKDAQGFAAWLEEIQTRGPGQGDPLFDWLASTASYAEFRWFLQQEVAGEAGFDDLVAMTQVKLPTREKLELARNYWDEMGHGREKGMHGPMLGHLERSFHLEGMQTPILWEARAVGYMMSALASNRWYVYQSLGALGAVELTAWRRAAKVNAGLKRLGTRGSERIYYAVHATLDKKHGEAWTREVFLPLVTRHPEAAPALAEGLLLRLTLGAQSYAAYRRVLWNGAKAALAGEAHVSRA